MKKIVITILLALFTILCSIFVLVLPPYTHAETKTVIVLFNDIRKFTSLCHHNKPENVARFLKDYFHTIVNIIATNNGFIHQIWGDGIIAIYPTADSQESCTQACANAIKSALEITKVTNLFSIKKYGLEAHQKYALKNGIGIALGRVFFDKVVGASVDERIIVGDAMNLASRLQNLNKSATLATSMQYPIIISQEVFINAPSFYKKQFSLLKEQKIKGFDIIIPVFGIKKEKD